MVEVPLTRSDMMRALTEFTLGTCGGWDRSPAESMLKMFRIWTGGDWRERVSKVVSSRWFVGSMTL